jgi:hypothetical protein
VRLASSQSLQYDVVRGDKKIGDMTVIRKIENESTIYEVESKVVFRLLFSFTVDYESTCEYKNEMLIKEYAHSELNGSTQKKSTIWFDGTSYTLDLDGSKIKLSDKKIDYSVGVVYFIEPKDQQKVFSPRFGQYLTFEKVNSNQYELESPDGLNVYTYLNGICTEVKVSRDFAKFYFKMTPESILAVENKSISSGSSMVD